MKQSSDYLFETTAMTITVSCTILYTAEGNDYHTYPDLIEVLVEDGNGRVHGVDLDVMVAAYRASKGWGI